MWFGCSTCPRFSVIYGHFWKWMSIFGPSARLCTDFSNIRWSMALCVVCIKQTNGRESFHWNQSVSRGQHSEACGWFQWKEACNCLIHTTHSAIDQRALLCWKKNFIRNHAHNFFILSLVFLKLLIVSVAFWATLYLFLLKYSKWIVIRSLHTTLQLSCAKLDGVNFYT